MSDEELWNGLPSLPGVIPTPWLHINAAIGGFQPGSLVALASEDGSAKEASRIIVNQWPHVNCAVINHGDLGELARREGRDYRDVVIDLHFQAIASGNVHLLTDGMPEEFSHHHPLQRLAHDELAQDAGLVIVNIDGVWQVAKNRFGAIS